MFVEHDEGWKERMEARREQIRAAKANGEFYDDCEDEPEYDYCEGDEDCEDDGDPMWE